MHNRCGFEPFFCGQTIKNEMSDFLNLLEFCFKNFSLCKGAIAYNFNYARKFRQYYALQP